MRFAGPAAIRDLKETIVEEIGAKNAWDKTVVTTTAPELWSLAVRAFGQKPGNMQYCSAAPFLGVDRAPGAPPRRRVTLKQGKWKKRRAAGPKLTTRLERLACGHRAARKIFTGGVVHAMSCGSEILGTSNVELEVLR